MQQEMTHISGGEKWDLKRQKYCASLLGKRAALQISGCQNINDIQYF